MTIAEAWASTARRYLSTGTPPERFVVDDHVYAALKADVKERNRLLDLPVIEPPGIVFRRIPVVRESDI